MDRYLAIEANQVTLEISIKDSKCAMGIALKCLRTYCYL